MNIHEHQAKELLKKYGANVPNGVFALTVKDILEKAKNLNSQKLVLKAQIHAGGRGKAGGVKILNDISELEKESNNTSNRTIRKNSKKTLCRGTIRY
jgi:succinyl-CoA synthetase beta subunit